MTAGPRRLTAQGQERKQQLLRCAAALFAERGFADTRVVDIVRAAGVAKGLFYWYFDNKEALFQELVEDTRRQLRITQAKAMDPLADPLVRLRQASEASVRFMAEHAHLYALMRAESLDRRIAGLMREGTSVHATDTVALIREAIDAGLVRDEEPVALAYGVVGAVAYYAHFNRTGRLPMSVDEVAAFVGRFIVHALAADDEIAARAGAGMPVGATSVSGR